MVIILIYKTLLNHRIFFIFHFIFLFNLIILNKLCHQGFKIFNNSLVKNITVLYIEIENNIQSVEKKSGI